MKVTFVGHASLLTEAAGVRILSDPWWRGPCFGAQWWLYPAAALDAVEAAPIDYIYVSHAHHDHFHPTTLRSLDRRARVLVGAGLGLAEPVRALGFEAIEVGPDEARALAPGLTCRIVPTDGGDSFMVLSDGREVLVNANDALHSSPREVQLAGAARVRAWHPRVDYLFCGYGVASHFPNCYTIPGKDPVRTALRRQRYFNREWATVVHDLAPTWAFPFAADVVLLEDELFWANEPTHNGERPTAAFRERFPEAATQVLDIAPGFTIADGVVRDRRLRQAYRAESVREELAEGIRRVNRAEIVDSPEVDEVARMLAANIQRVMPYLRTFPGDYRGAIRFRNEARGIAVVKRAGQVDSRVVPAGEIGEPDVVLTTRVPYLRASLSSPFGHETIFVGSGGIFEYRAARRVGAAVHRELVAMIRPADQAPSPRPTGWRGRLSRLRRALRRRLAGGPGGDLYDLRAWTVMDSER